MLSPAAYKRATQDSLKLFRCGAVEDYIQLHLPHQHGLRAGSRSTTASTALVLTANSVTSSVWIPGPSAE